MCKYHILSNARTSIFKYETISKMVSLSFVRNIPKVTLQVIEAVQAGFPWTNSTSKKNYMVLAKKMQVQEMTRPLTNLLPCSFFGSKQTCSNFLHFTFEQMSHYWKTTLLWTTPLCTRRLVQSSDFFWSLFLVITFPDYNNNFVPVFY